MRSGWNRIGWSISAATHLAFGASGLAAQDFAVVGARLVQAEAGESGAPVTIVVSDGVIASIGPVDIALDTTMTWIDGEGRLVAPGGVAALDAVPKPQALDWREEMLVRLSAGVTTLVAPGAAIASATSQLPAGYPAVRFVPETGADGGSRASTPLEVGADARFLILEEDPRVDSRASTRPLAVVVGTRIHSREQLEFEARSLAREGRVLLYRHLPSIGQSHRAPWPLACLAESDFRCLGPDPECALLNLLLLADLRAPDCRAPEAAEARKRWLASLVRLASVAPSDDWIVGQRVHAALIDRDFDQALAAVDACAAETWWCDALRGLVLHTRVPGSGRAAFAAAIAAVPRDAPAWRDPAFPESGDRGAFCEWRDVAYLIEERSVRDEYASHPCGEGAEFEERVWWLSDLLWSEPGNLRRDEHIARNIRAKSRGQYLETTDNVGDRWTHGHCDVSLPAWGWDSSPSGEVRCRSSHADWVRFGAPDSWRGVEHVRSPGFVIGADGKLILPAYEKTQCIGIERVRMCRWMTTLQLREGFLSGGYSFVPTGVALATPEASSPADWAVALGEGHERMVTEDTWYNLDQQTAVLRRGDSLRVLSAGAFPTLLPSLDELDATLALGRVADREVLLHAADVDRATGVLRAEAMIEDTDWVVSLEASAPGVRGRARQGAIAPVLVDSFGISKPVFVREDFDPQTDDLLEAMVPSNTLPGSGATGMYIELYGVEAGQQVRMTLSYELGEVRRSFFGRIASALGIGGGPSGPVTVEWTEQLETVREGVGSIFVAADLGDLPTGEVELSLSASLEGQSASSSTTVQSR